MIKLGPVSAIQSKGRRDQAHSAPSLCVSWEQAALGCVHLSTQRSPPAQKPSDLYLHQKPSGLYPVPSAPVADERHQEHGGQETVQGTDEEVHGKTEVAGNVGSMGIGYCSSDQLYSGPVDHNLIPRRSECASEMTSVQCRQLIKAQSYLSPEYKIHSSEETVQLCLVGTRGLCSLPT